VNDPDYAVVHPIRVPNPGACTVREVWADSRNSIWLESTDGQRVQIPQEQRHAVARLVKVERWRHV
jgi:hypothetical protein